MTLDRLKTDIKPKTLRATLYRMNLSFRMFREVQRKSTDPETCKKFVKDTRKRIDALAETRYANFYEDEMTMLLASQASRRWHPRGEC